MWGTELVLIISVARLADSSPALRGGVAAEATDQNGLGHVSCHRGGGLRGLPQTRSGIPGRLTDL